MTSYNVLAVSCGQDYLHTRPRGTMRLSDKDGRETCFFIRQTDTMGTGANNDEEATARAHMNLVKRRRTVV
jgi:hypothetical protein